MPNTTIERFVTRLVDTKVITPDQASDAIATYGQILKEVKYAADLNSCVVCGQDFGSQIEVYARKRRAEFAKAALPGLIAVNTNDTYFQHVSNALSIADIMITQLDAQAWRE